MQWQADLRHWYPDRLEAKKEEGHEFKSISKRK